MARPYGFSFGSRYVQEAAHPSAASVRETTTAFAEKLTMLWLAREGTYNRHAKDSKVEYRRKAIRGTREVEATKGAALLHGTYHCRKCDDIFVMYDRPTSCGPESTRRPSMSSAKESEMVATRPSVLESSSDSENSFWRLAKGMYRLDLLKGVLVLPLSPSDLKRLADLVFGELEKGLINVRYLLENGKGDRETLENCLHWAHVHVEIATSLFPFLVCAVPFSAWREPIERELALLAKATQDLRKAERHADDPEALGGFLRPARKHIESAMAVHTRLTEKIRSGAE